MVEALGRVDRWVGWDIVWGSTLGVMGGAGRMLFIFSEFSLVKNLLKLKPDRCMKCKGTKYFEWDQSQCLKLKTH